jgi:hypothetical protein
MNIWNLSLEKCELRYPVDPNYSYKNINSHVKKVPVSNTLAGRRAFDLVFHDPELVHPEDSPLHSPKTFQRTKVS